MVCVNEFEEEGAVEDEGGNVGAGFGRGLEEGSVGVDVVHCADDNVVKEAHLDACCPRWVIVTIPTVRWVWGGGEEGETL